MSQNTVHRSFSFGHTFRIMPNHEELASRKWHWECCQCGMRDDRDDHVLTENGDCKNCADQTNTPPRFPNFAWGTLAVALIDSL